MIWVKTHSTLKKTITAQMMIAAKALTKCHLSASIWSVKAISAAGLPPLRFAKNLSRILKDS
jgi:hypothetical protein